MRRLIQVRDRNTAEGCFGRLLDEHQEQLAISLELPWRGNARNISCIPTGSYTCTYNYSPAFKRNMYLLLDVPNRSGIRIHKGSYAGAQDHGLHTNFLGCIGWGRGILYDNVRKQHFVHTTAATIAAIEQQLQYKDFILTIIGEHEELTNG